MCYKTFQDNLRISYRYTTYAHDAVKYSFRFLMKNKRKKKNKNSNKSKIT